jgi:PIN domain nuclease of toxin-antitoxin system
MWEMAIKTSLARLQLSVPIEEFIERGATQNGILELPITRAHVLGVATLPFHHRDPFDRLLVAQARTEGLTLLSADSVLDAYPVTRVW